MDRSKIARARIEKMRRETRAAILQLVEEGWLSAEDGRDAIADLNKCSVIDLQKTHAAFCK